MRCLSIAKLGVLISHERLGLILITMGVAAWIPYGILKHGLGQEVTFYPFLILHLAGIIPGFVLRRGELLRRLLLRRRPPSETPSPSTSAHPVAGSQGAAAPVR